MDFRGFIFKLCPSIPELKLWVFWAPIFIKEAVRGENHFIVPNQFDSIDL
jgi:hypothetical protein